MISEDGYDNDVGRHPDRAATAKFVHEYLDTKVGNNIFLKENIEAVRALELAAGSPKLYARAAAFQGALGEPSRKDLRDLRRWLLPRYRRLMLEIAQSMVTTHKKTPGSFEDDKFLKAFQASLTRARTAYYCSPESSPWRPCLQIARAYWSAFRTDTRKRTTTPATARPSA